jgi:uncharacterized protein YbjT (DUF2867 family)
MIAIDFGRSKCSALDDNSTLQNESPVEPWTPLGDSENAGDHFMATTLAAALAGAQTIQLIVHIRKSNKRAGAA